MNTLIKWPGGKTREIRYLERLVPPHRRYVEPFFGGGAMFFHLRPERAVINDVSRDLTDFYGLVKERDPVFRGYLLAYGELLGAVLRACDERAAGLLELYRRMDRTGEAELRDIAGEIAGEIPDGALEALILDREAFIRGLSESAGDKMRRTLKNEEKRPFSEADLVENLITGFAGGVYMYFRGVYNDIHLGRGPQACREYRCANFYFVREYCYGSMFRYNAGGEFNIPYGGMSYNRKDFLSKVGEMFSPEVGEMFRGTEIFCRDFEGLLEELRLTEEDFVFLDPPYDTDFSDYEGRSFGREDQIRLRDALRRTRARFMLVIKNTSFIHSLYERGFCVVSFDKTYTYNVRSRNRRDAEHLVITNMDR